MGTVTVEKIITTWGLDNKEFLRKAQQADKKIGRIIKKAETFSKIGRGIRNVGSTLFRSLTLPIALIGGAVIKMGADFEFSMNKVRALTGATGEDLGFLAERAKFLGRTTQFSASQAAEAMGALGLAGFKTGQILDSVNGVLLLAGAANLDMANAAGINAKVLNAFNLEASEAGRVGDVLTQAFTNAATDLPNLSQALKVAGPVANSLGRSLEETVATLQLFAAAGFEGSMAGTALKSGLARLVNPTKEVKNGLKSLGISLDEVNPSTNDLVSIFKKLEDAGAGAQEMFKIFGLRAAPAFVAGLSQGSAELERFNGLLGDADGRAKQINDTMLEGARGAWVKMKSATEGLAIAIANSGILESFTKFVLLITDVISGMATLNPGMLKFLTIVAATAAALGPLLIGLGMLVQFGGALLKFTGILKGLSTVMAAFKVGGIAGVLASLGPLLPFLLPLLAVGGLGFLAFRHFRKKGAAQRGGGEAAPGLAQRTAPTSSRTTITNVDVGGAKVIQTFIGSVRPSQVEAAARSGAARGGRDAEAALRDASGGT